MCSMENTTMKWENTSMKALSGALCYCTLTPVVKYNCIMFYSNIKQHTNIQYQQKYFFQKCCSLYITANTTGCVNYLHRTNNRKWASTVKKKKKTRKKKKQKKTRHHP